MKIPMLATAPWLNRLMFTPEPHKCSYREFKERKQTYITSGLSEKDAFQKAIDHYAALEVL